MTSLNIVGHPDDDLLFLNPDILEDRGQHNLVFVVYMTMGNDGNNHSDSLVKMEASANAYGIAIAMSLYVLSNSHRTGDSYGSLYRMWNDSEYQAPRLDGGLPWHREHLIEQIRGLIESAKPDVIRTHDPDTEPAIDHDEPQLDHIDHIYTAKFVQEAAKVFPLIPVYAYEGYPIRYKEPNVAPELATKKLAMWRKYQEIDTSVAGEIWDVAMTRQYKRRIQ